MSAATQASTTGSHRQTRRVVGRTRWFSAWVAMICAVVAWTVAGPVLGNDLTVRLGSADATQRVGLTSVAVTSVLAGLAAWALLALLERLTARARAVWTALAVLALVLSMAGPLAGVSSTAKISLACLHLIVGAVLIVGLRRSMRRR